MVLSKPVRLAAGLALGCGLVAALPPQPAAAADYTMKCTTATIRDAQHEWMNNLKKRLEKTSNGRIEVGVYPASQLGSIPRMVEGVQLGTIECWVGPPDFLVGLDPRYMIYSVPGVITDIGHAVRVFADPRARKTMFSMGDSKGIEGIATFVTNTSVYVTRKPVRKIEDFKGMKIRVFATKVERETMDRLGATAAPMPLDEVLTALQRGTIDGVKSGLTIFTAFKYYNTAKYLTMTEEAVVSTVAVVSKAWMSRLPAELQAMVRGDADKAEKETQEWAVKWLKSQEKVWTDNGGELIRFTPAQHAKMMADLSTVGDKVLSDNAAVKKAYDELKMVAKETEKK